MTENTLLDAVDALTKPRPVAHWQVDHEHTLVTVVDDAGNPDMVCEWCDDPDSDDDGKRLRHRTDPPLLDWLREAITNSIGGSGGGRQPRERTPVDVGAFTLYEDIDGRVRSWMLELGARPGAALSTAEVLRSWYVLYTAQSRDEHNEGRHTSILRGWEQAILDKLDPPKRIELEFPCPACGKMWHNVGLKLADGSDDPNDVERVRALNAIERDTIDESYAICSACARVWKGVGQMRLLRAWRDEIEAKAAEAAKNGMVTA